jgi:RNA polymerase sigma-70 factor (ECF subfamily)
MVETDELLMLAVRDGEITKLGILFDRHHSVLFDYLLRMTGNRTAAEDLVQEVFLRILKYRKTFQDNSRFTAWMFRIARNARMDHHRKRRIETTFPEEGVEIQNRSAFAIEELERQQESILLERAMLKLPEDKREVLVLSRYREMKYEDIAELLGCEVSTVKTRVHRALKELREIFLKFSSEKTSWNAKKSEVTFRIT